MVTQFDKGRQATWNAGMLSVMRLNNVMTQANMFSLNGNLSKWHAALRIMYREATSKMSKKEFEQSAHWDKKITPAVINYEQFRKSADNHQRFQAISEYQDILHKYEIWIRTVLDSHGMLNPDADDPRLAAMELT